MKTLVARGLMTLAAVGLIATAAPAAEWTSPEEVAKAAADFADAAKHLHDSIRAVAEDSPLVEQVGTLEQSVRCFHESVEEGATFEHAAEDFGKITRAYDRFQEALKEDHDVHHDEQVAADAKRMKASFDHLQARMEGRREPARVGREP